MDTRRRHDQNWQDPELRQRMEQNEKPKSPEHSPIWLHNSAGKSVHMVSVQSVKV